MKDRYGREMAYNLEGYYIPSDHQFSKPHNNFKNYQMDLYSKSVKTCTDFRRAIDAGAHVGIMSLRLSKTFDVVESFEPILDEYLKQNVGKNVNVYNHALGEKETTVSMEMGVYNSGMSAVKPAHEIRNAAKLISNVSVKTIDSYEFDDVDFIKIDVERYEWQVIQGAMKTIERCLPVCCIELHNDYKDKSRVLKYFDDLGYTCVQIKDDYIFSKDSK